jgi:hypothetical protein
LTILLHRSVLSLGRTLHLGRLTRHLHPLCLFRRACIPRRRLSIDDLPISFFLLTLRILLLARLGPAARPGTSPAVLVQLSSFARLVRLQDLLEQRESEDLFRGHGITFVDFRGESGFGMRG